MEQMFVNNNFHYVRVVPISNGVTWSTSQMCEQIGTFYRASNFFGEKVVVWMDREGRTESATVIAHAVKNQLIKDGLEDRQIAIMLCDRMTENLILADVSLIRD